jgi:PiT family inorganic phosphate transporter
MGVGATNNLKRVRWSTARSMVWAWILTVPISAMIAAFSYVLIKLLGI